MNNEFEEMRQQMIILKEKLQQQDIVNEKVMRRTMKRNVSGINRRYTFVSILCILMIPYSYWAFVSLTGMSIYFWAATSVFMLLCFGYTVYNGRHLNSRLFSKDLLKARTEVANAKKLDHDWLKIGIPICILWLGFLGYELYQLGLGDHFIPTVILLAVCALAGAAVGLKIHFKNQDEYAEIIDEIDDFTKQ